MDSDRGKSRPSFSARCLLELRAWLVSDAGWRAPTFVRLAVQSALRAHAADLIAGTA